MPLWYYAKNDRQNGPIDEDELRSLIASGEIRTTDEVWCDGMTDWQPAGELSELFPDKAQSERPVAPPPIPTSPQRRSGADINLAGTLNRFDFDLLKLAKPFGQVLLVAGFLMVIGFKGCDAVSQRYAERVKAQSTLATREFNYEYEQRQARLELERDEINAKSELSEYDQSRLESIDESLVELQENRDKEQSRLRRTTWQRLQHAADTADANRQQWALMFTMGFVFGTMLLTVGLLIVGLTGEGAKGWICLGILGIIAFSLYVGGAAWIGRFLP